jgi:heme-degrading monooxygenase HmoA
LIPSGPGDKLGGSPKRRLFMHARVSTYQSDDPDRLVEGFESVSGSLEDIDGFSHAYFMVDRESGKAISVTIWESEEALTASSKQADELRKQGTEPSGSTVNTVAHYEIRHTVGSPAPTRS